MMPGDLVRPSTNTRITIGDNARPCYFSDVLLVIADRFNSTVENNVCLVYCSRLQALGLIWFGDLVNVGPFVE